VRTVYFYDRLKDLRKEKGYTIREVAERSGVSTAYISQLENGQRGVPSPEVLMKLSEGLNASYESLMITAGYLPGQGEHRPKTDAPVNLRRFLRDNDLMFDGVRLTEEDKERVERLLTALFWKEKRNAGEQQ
jgi:transcriptional regulator with XRE-family HTH domain